MNESSFLSKRPSTSEVNNANPKKPKPSESVSGANSSTVLPSVKSPSVTSSQAMLAKGKYEIWYVKRSYSIYTYILEVAVNLKSIISSYLRLKNDEF